MWWHSAYHFYSERISACVVIQEFFYPPFIYAYTLYIRWNQELPIVAIFTLFVLYIISFIDCFSNQLQYFVYSNSNGQISFRYKLLPTFREVRIKLYFIWTRLCWITVQLIAHCHAVKVFFRLHFALLMTLY